MKTEVDSPLDQTRARKVRKAWIPRRPCGKYDLELPILGMGCWAYGGGDYWGPQNQKDVKEVVRFAIEHGCNFFDTAEAYNDGASEASLGLALQGIPREQVIIGTKISQVLYLGRATGAAWLDKIGVSFQRTDKLRTDAGLLRIGPDAVPDPKTLTAYVERGGKAFFLPCSRAEGPFGTTLKPAAEHFAGSLSAPDWPEARGLSASDLRSVVTWILRHGF
jgi:Aldo/keto reductase family